MSKRDDGHITDEEAMKQQLAAEASPNLRSATEKAEKDEKAKMVIAKPLHTEAELDKLREQENEEHRNSRTPPPARRFPYGASM